MLSQVTCRKWRIRLEEANGRKVKAKEWPFMEIARSIQKQVYCWFGWVYGRKASCWVRAARNIATWGPTRRACIDEARYGNMKWTFKSGKWYAYHDTLTLHLTIPCPCNIMTFFVVLSMICLVRGTKRPVGGAKLKYRKTESVYKPRAWLALDFIEVDRSKGVM